MSSLQDYSLSGFVFHGFTPMATTCRHSVAKSPLAPLKVAYPEVVFQKQQTFDERAFLGPSGFVVGLASSSGFKEAIGCHASRL